MMSLMKAFSGLGGFLILAIGLAMLGVTIYGFINSELLFNEYHLLGVLLAADLLIIVVAALGILGIKRGHGVLICVFQIFVIIFFFTFLGLGIGAEVLPKTVFQGNCTTSDNELIGYADYAYTKSAMFCTALCPCGLTQQAIDNGGYDQNDTARIDLLVRSADGPTQAQKCDLMKNENQTIQNMFSFLDQIEKALDCSGWCPATQPVILYKFSNVNHGKPHGFCYDTMKYSLEKYGHVIGLSAFGVATFLLLVCLCNLCICCSPERKKLPLRSRFVYNDGGYYRAV